MQQSHKLGFQEYSRNFDNQLLVEYRRERNYKKCKQIAAELEHNLHR